MNKILRPIFVLLAHLVVCDLPLIRIDDQEEDASIINSRSSTDKISVLEQKPEAAAFVLSRDRRLLFGSRTLRLFAYGLLAVVLALYLAAVGMSDRQIGVLLTLTLVGDALV